METSEINQLDSADGTLSRDVTVDVTHKKKRRPIPLGLRFKVLNRDGFRCRYCGASSGQVVLHVDHVIPRSRDGDNEETNLVTSCRDCNLGKSARLIEGPDRPLPSSVGGTITIAPDAVPIEAPPVTYWRGDQWKVTSQGIDTVDNQYFIAAHRIWEEDHGYGWPQHMREKPWVMLWEFVEALEFARRLFVFGPKPQVRSDRKRR